METGSGQEIIDSSKEKGMEEWEDVPGTELWRQGVSLAKRTRARASCEQ